MYFRKNLKQKFDLEKSGKGQENFSKKSEKISQLDMEQPCLRYFYSKLKTLFSLLFSKKILI